MRLVDSSSNNFEFLEANIHNNLGAIYMRMLEFDQAIPQFEMLKEYSVATYGKSSPGLSTALHNLGMAYWGNRDFSKAKSFFRQSTNTKIQVYGEKHIYLADTYNMLGVVFLVEGMYDSALHYMQKSLCLYAPELDPENYYAKLPLEGIDPEPQLVPYIKNKAIAFRRKYFQSKDPKDLDAALSHYELVIDFLDSMRLNHHFLKSGDLLVEKSYELYGGVIEMCMWKLEEEHDVAFVEKAFQASEKSKVLALTRAMNGRSIREKLGIPDSLDRKSLNIQQKMGFYERILAEEQSKGIAAKPERLKNFQSKIFSLQEEQVSLNAHLRKQYPAYYQSISSQELPKLQDIQHTLRDSAAIIEYHWNDSSLFAFIITQDSTQIHARPGVSIKKSLDSLLTSLRQAPQRKSEEIINYRQFTTSASSLYKELLLPLLGGLQGVKELIIIPDGPLGYLPFELLLEHEHDPDCLEDCDYNSLSYLLRRYQIHYEYSCGLLAQSRDRLETEYNYLGFAPMYRGKSNWKVSRNKSLNRVRGELPLSKMEVVNAAETLEGKYFLGENANYERFVQNISRAKILHLATHAVVIDSLPEASFLQFNHPEQSDQDSLFFLYDLYGLPIHAELAILSACQTGLGRIQRGEGILSLAWAFKYAGCPNIATSLWDANDFSASQIMTDFTQNLKAGMEKDEALQKAKLDYLDKKIESHYKHPHYWGTFVLIGDDKPMTFERSPVNQKLLMLIFLGLLVLGLGIGYLLKKNNTIHIT